MYFKIDYPLPLRIYTASERRKTFGYNTEHVNSVSGRVKNNYKGTMFSLQGVRYFGREATRKIEPRQCTCQSCKKSPFSSRSRKPGKSSEKEGARAGAHENNSLEGGHCLIAARYTTG